MRASQILQNSLGEVLPSIHAYRRRALALAVDALVGCGRLVLMDLARRCEGYEFVRPALKRMDRLLANPRLHDERIRLYGAVAHLVCRGPHPVILIDWSPVKDGRDFYLLRAAMPVDGRAVVVFESIHPAATQASPAVERKFLQQLACILPAGTQPILVTDAGFRGPWCCAVAARGWLWITRLRHTTQVCPKGKTSWIAGKDLQSRASKTARDAGLFEVAKSAPVTARIALYRAPKKYRHDLNRNGRVARNKRSRSMAARSDEAWVLLSSPELKLKAKRIVAIYARRMQIEQTFRDTKTAHHGLGYEYSLTRKIKRIEILLLIQMLAVFAMWIAGVMAVKEKLDVRLKPNKIKRRLYSLVRVGREALLRNWFARRSPPLRQAVVSLLHEAMPEPVLCA